MNEGGLEKQFGEVLIDELMPYTKLTEEDRLKLVELARKLEEEFGDLTQCVEGIREAYDAELDKVRNHGFFHFDSLDRLREDYLSGRDENVLWDLVQNHPEILEECSRITTESICSLIRYRIESASRLVDGGAKSADSIRERIRLEEEDRGSRNITRFLDITRGRCIVERIDDVGYVFSRLFHHFAFGDSFVSARNRYVNKTENWRQNTGRENPFLCASLAIAIDDDVTYELQILTERAARIAELDHPARAKPRAALLDEEQNYLEALAWGSHLTDVRDYIVEIEAEWNK